jgi:hypothetical protein
MRLLRDWLAPRVQARTAGGEEERERAAFATPGERFRDLVSNVGSRRAQICGAARDPLVWRELSSSGEVNSRRSPGDR